MSGEISDNRAHGSSFLAIGIAMTVLFGLTMGPAFMGLGAPFIVLGLIVMARKQADATSEGDK